MNLDEAKQEIARLEKRYEELEKEDKKKTLQIDELKHIESELKDEKGQLRKELIDLWKDEVRENFNGDELTRYEKRLEKMDIWNLKEEKSLLESIVKSKSSGGSLDSGDGESDSDSSDGGGDDEGSQLKSQSGGGKDVKSLRKTKDNPKKAVHDLDKSLDDDDIPRPPSPESSSLHRMFPGIG